jgi:hypothetical protein
MKTVEVHPLTRDAVYLIHELGMYISNSPKMKERFHEVSARHGDPFTLRPLCPTRWLVKGRALTGFFKHREQLLNMLDEFSNDKTIG